MDKKVGVILSGCGVYDGSEIQEAVAALIALDEHNLEARCFAPNIDQMHVVNHLTGQVMAEKRNVLAESARIVRGKISALDADSVSEVDAILLPGGFGAAKNLSNYATAGIEMSVNELVAETLKQAHRAGKPIAALCISPILLAAVFGDHAPKLTLGEYGDDAKKLEALGGNHFVTQHEEVVIDEELKLISGPCYMLDSTVAQIYGGAVSVVKALKSFL